jgi:hypothetical protein
MPAFFITFSLIMKTKFAMNIHFWPKKDPIGLTTFVSLIMKTKFAMNNHFWPRKDPVGLKGVLGVFWPRERPLMVLWETQTNICQFVYAPLAGTNHSTPSEA